jgi:serine/threonine-protein kinase
VGFDDDSLRLYRGPRTGTVFFMSLIVSAATAAGTVYALRELAPEKPPAPSKSEIAEVPAIAGMPMAQAREMLDARGLLLVLDGERDDGSVAPGTIVAQTPLAGSRARPGGEVHATLARAPAKLKVPDVAKLDVDKATQALVEVKLVVAGQDPEASPDVAPGTVLGTTPPAGTDVAPGSDVRLRVSSGAAPIDVPKVVGLPLKKAKDAITAAKLSLGLTKYTYDENRGPYVVLRQDPAAGAKAAPGSTINLVVNQGP